MFFSVMMVGRTVWKSIIEKSSILLRKFFFDGFLQQENQIPISDHSRKLSNPKFQNNLIQIINIPSQHPTITYLLLQIENDYPKWKFRLLLSFHDCQTLILFIFKTDSTFPLSILNRCTQWEQIWNN